jgi:hypothetical protein
VTMRTQTGRVVYNRAVHLFNYGDVLRIVRKVDPRSHIGTADSTTEGLAILGTILAAEKDFLTFLSARALAMVPEQALGRDLLEVLTLVVQILVKAPASVIGEFVALVLPVILPWVSVAAAAGEEEEEGTKEIPNGETD